MRILPLVVSALGLIGGVYACSNDESESDESTGVGGQTARATGGQSGTARASGGTASSGTSTRTSGGTSPLSSAVSAGARAGASNSTGVAGVPPIGGAGGTGARDNASTSGAPNETAGRSSVSASAGFAGTSHLNANDAGRSNAGGSSSATAGTTNGLRGGAAGTAGTGYTAAGASGEGCTELCGASNCASAPQCLEAAYGLTNTMPFCIPTTNLGIAVICKDTTCSDGSAGCQMTVTFSGTAWTLSPAPAAGQTSVSVSSRVTKIDGEIGVPTLSCKLTINLPAAGAPFTAAGATRASTDVPGTSDVAFDSIDAPLTGMSFSSTVPNCESLANATLVATQPSLRNALLDALNAKADPLHCSACRGECPERLACVKN